MKRVILEDTRYYFGMDHADHVKSANDSSMIVFRDYDAEHAWASELNVFDITEEQYERWQAAHSAWQAAQREIRATVQQRRR